MEEIIKKARDRNISRYEMLEKYYRGENDILKRPKTPYKPNNLLATAFAYYIVTVNSGYLMGKPVAYYSQNDNFLDDLTDLFDYNDEQDVNMELAKIASKKGKAFELLFFDEEAKLRFTYLEPDEAFVIMDDKVIPEMQYGVYYSFNDEYSFVYIYEKKDVYFFEGKGNDVTLTEQKAHGFEDVPMVEYANNDERMSDFERVINLIDSYDMIQSDTSNDYEYFADAYLKIIGMGGTNSADISDMRKNRTLLLDKESDAQFLVKPSGDATQLEHKHDIKSDIHKISMTPDLTDEAFAGNLSGVALQFKLWGLEQNTGVKERKFKRGLQRRIELICQYYKVKGKDYDYRDINMTFSRNIPQNDLEKTQTALMQAGFISNYKLLSLLPSVDDPLEEKEMIAKERDEDTGLGGVEALEDEL